MTVGRNDSIALGQVVHNLVQSHLTPPAGKINIAGFVLNAVRLNKVIPILEALKAYIIGVVAETSSILSSFGRT